MAAAKRIGPAMTNLVAFLHSTGGVARSSWDLIQVVGWGSRQYGYPLVARCVDAGLVTIERDHPDAMHGICSGAVVITDAGRAVAAAAIDNEYAL